jgi:hypothetical protein
MYIRGSTRKKRGVYKHKVMFAAYASTHSLVVNYP